jgi:hypothetical protein
LIAVVFVSTAILKKYEISHRLGVVTVRHLVKGATIAVERLPKGTLDLNRF